MITGQSSSYDHFRRFLLGGCWLLLAASCTIIKNYPPNKPFVYKTNINITGNIASDTSGLIATRLKAQLDDSMRARSVSKVLWSVMKKPPVYKKENAEKSVTYMNALLNSMGYFRDSITFDTVVNRKGDQYQTTVTFEVKPGKVVKIDSFNYNIKQEELQRIALANQQDAFVKKGDPFAKAPISSELDRLVVLYRDSGYLRFGRELLIGLWDTLDVSLLRPTFDPIEQLEILQKLQERRENPTANLEIRLKPGFDSSKLTKYYVGNITIYPDYGPDTTAPRKEEMVEGMKVISFQNRFRPRILPDNVLFRRGDTYSQTQYTKTITRFNSLGAWRMVNIEPVARKNQDTADFIIKLTPAKKYSFTANIEGSRNYTALSGNLFGIAVNVGLQNRNFARAANSTTTNFRYGIEASGSSFIQTQQIVVSHTISFPRLVPRFKWIPQRIRQNTRTIFSFNAANTERKDLFNLTTVNGSWGYEYLGKNSLFTLRFPNIEYSYLKPRQDLLDLFIGNPALKNIFTDGLISSVIAGMTLSNHKNKIDQIFRTNAELSGLIAGLIKSDFFDSNLYRFIKIDAEFIRKMSFRRSALVLRLFTGVGYEFNSTVNPDKRNNLPFFKQYFAGGPNSMRAWGLRKLGRGSTVKYFSGTGSTPERYGDVQVEANVELRFPAFVLAGIKINGALFTDIGNIWFLKKEANPMEPQEIFSFNRLAKDLAVGIGTGLRVDFDFFVIRLDFSYKAKDPSPSPANAALQNKWFGYGLRNGTQFQLGISYPFIL